MKITLQNVDRLSLAEMQEFVQRSRRIEFAAQDRGATYKLVERVVRAVPSFINHLVIYESGDVGQQARPIVFGFHSEPPSCHINALG
jgi:hypothetical protein